VKCRASGTPDPIQFPFLLRGGDDYAIAHQARRAVVVKSRDAEDVDAAVGRVEFLISLRKNFAG